MPQDIGQLPAKSPQGTEGGKDEEDARREEAQHRQPSRNGNEGCQGAREVVQVVGADLEQWDETPSQGNRTGKQANPANPQQAYKHVEVF